MASAEGYILPFPIMQPQSGLHPDAMIWEVLLLTERRIRQLTAPELMRDIWSGVRYVEGISVTTVTTVTEEVAA